MPRKKSVNHGKIVEAAKKEFERCGFKEASMRNIAAEAGMSASGLYKHFPSKEETSTLAFISELRKKGEAPIDLPRKEVHLLVTAQVNAVFEAVKHGFSKEEALHYADTLDGFFMPGWLHVMGVPAEVLQAEVSA